MYLTETDVKELLQAIYVNSRPGSFLVGTLLKPAANGQLVIPGTSRLVDLRLQIMGEPYQWGLAPKDTSAFFTEFGFKVLEIVNDKNLLAQYLPDVESRVSLPEGEYFFRASQIG
jgi:O-methyltransferase involved in polyketide biosynthesis